MAQKFGENGKSFPEEKLFGGKSDLEALKLDFEGSALAKEAHERLKLLDEEIDVANEKFRLKLDNIDKGEGVNEGGEWLLEEPPGDFKERFSGKKELVADYTPKEEEIAREMSADFYEEARNRFDSEYGGGVYEDFESMDEDFEISNEREEDRELMQLLLRISIKVGTKVAVSVAKQIAKDRENSKAVRYMAGVFGDLVGEGGKFAEKFITGEDNPDLSKDIISYIKS